MKKIGIVTIIDNDNYGNRLQNYAVQEIIKREKCYPVTIKNHFALNSKGNLIISILKYIVLSILKRVKSNKSRYKKFKEFNKNIKFSLRIATPYSKIKRKYDYFIAGSDQIWKPNYGRMKDMDLLTFANYNQKISFAASFGVSNLSQEDKIFLKEKLKDFKNISVREEDGKKIIEELVKNKDVEVLIDPTMMLTAKEWDSVSKKPQQLKNERYILNYFLGNITEEYKQEIERVAKENNCSIINILDKNDPFYSTGPSEFLYLEKNAFLVCTDSFHSCIFSIIFDTPFINFERVDNRVCMNSRLKTLLKKFELEDRKFKGKIDEKLLKHDYKRAYEILKIEKKKSSNFIRKALDIQ